MVWVLLIAISTNAWIPTTMSKNNKAYCEEMGASVSHQAGMMVKAYTCVQMLKDDAERLERISAGLKLEE